MLLILIVVTGSGVRLTGSGLGCTDWPNCTDERFVAELETHQMVEFVNRLITGLVSAAVVLAVLGSLRRSPRRRDLTLLSLGLVAGVVAMIQFVAKVLVANEKVFSLYIALGFRPRDMLWLIVRYTLPTVAFPLMAIVMAMVAGAALVQPGLDAETAELLRMLWIIVPLFLLVLLLLFTLIVVGIVSNWWWATARNLTEHLKDG